MSSYYLKIAVSSENEADSYELKRCLTERGIFSRAFNNREARNILSDTDLLINIADSYTSSAAALLSMAEKRAPSLATVIVADLDVYSRFAKMSSQKYTLVLKDGCVTESVFDILPLDHMYSDKNGIVTDLRDGCYVLYRGVRLFLTPSEALILHYLNRFCGGSASADDIAGYVCVSKASVPVLISGINKKAIAVTGCRAVSHKRGCGYVIINSEQKE